ncbi:hypothetical protein CVT26_010237 [Gymnopilus dilepis]|uniref:Tyrosine specific protein phosphatases domain-containing protein n=1 Tax=Gymnopilus dilepis TaxID=231916 RepID=A0A409Y170_9AGAR|nr:hypothetical protein CVT26_010237 [Gymnopilus dilepis]
MLHSQLPPSSQNTKARNAVKEPWSRFRRVEEHVLGSHPLFRSSCPGFATRRSPPAGLTLQCLEFLINHGIKRVINLEQDSRSYSPQQLDSLVKAGIDYRHLPVEDMHAPDEALLRAAYEFYAAGPEGESTLVHCTAGYGRTGTFVTAIQLFVTQGRYPESEDVNDVETESQKEILKKIRRQCLEKFSAESREDED